MKKYGTYNEALTKIKEVEPVISINDNKDKYIKLTANDNKTVSLLFIIKNILKIKVFLKDLDTHHQKMLHQHIPSLWDPFQYWLMFVIHQKLFFLFSFHKTNLLIEQKH